MRRILSERQIQSTVSRLAGAIRTDYAERRPVLVGVLKGAFVFLADLVREIGAPVEVDFIDISSYGAGQVSSGAVQLVSDITCDIRGRDVILVEDIVDSGLSIAFLRQHLLERGPASLRVCSLLVREGSCPGLVDYAGRVIPSGFIVGYGIDWAEDYRYLREIRMLEGEGGRG